MKQHFGESCCFYLQDFVVKALRRLVSSLQHHTAPHQDTECSHWRFSSFSSTSRGKCRFGTSTEPTTALFFSLSQSLINLSVHLYNPSNTTKENTLSYARLHVSTLGSHHQTFLRTKKKLKLQWWSAHGILRNAWWWLPEVETCSLAQDNVFSLVVIDRLYRYTDSVLRNGMDSIKFYWLPVLSLGAVISETETKWWDSGGSCSILF
jgi:hypothetical protein